ncbi:YibE/F family protein [Brachybacterium sp. FME24]|uniref:YibE/F family protein n=1 Tax=Brachybacterium sp. FME24 TaxID=2742605 RepID=UPI001868E27C|nr:YibE/F family protein [Brachybacterium sp. FME24]
MASGHSHSHRGRAPASPRSRTVLISLTVALLLLTIFGLIRLWPDSDSRPESAALLAPGVEILSVEVTAIPGDTQPQESMLVEATGRSGDIRDENVQVEVTPEIAADGIHTGDRIRVPAIDEAGDDAPYFYFDHERGVPLGALFVLYLLVVALVARGAGLRAVLGLAAGVAIVVLFMLPAILAGEDAVLVALVGGSAMIFPCVYFAHGISIRTTTAVLGTFGGIAITVVAALAAGRPAGMTGTDGEAAKLLAGSNPEVSLSAVFLAGVIISGLGALNDVTITQASSVWELRAAMPSASRWTVFSSAMRIGRDHIASTVYTLAYAYIGSALPTLLFASMLERSFLGTLAAGEIAAEVFRTLIASIGLVLAIPLTTGIAALLATSTGAAEKPVRKSRRQMLEERLGVL